MTKRVVCAGRVYCDIIFTGLNSLPQPGREVFAEDLTLRAGGGAFTTAAYLAQFSRPVSLMAHLPAAPFADYVTAEAERYNVDLSVADVATSAVPQITVAMVGAGDRAFLSKRSDDALPADWETVLGRHHFDHLHIGELTTLVENPGLIAAARKAGMTISLDCGWDDKVLSADPSTLVSKVDLFLPNDDEADALASYGRVQDMAPCVVVKRGAKGATAHGEGTTLTRGAAAARVIDSTGAGDAFAAGFVHAWLDGQDLGKCLDLGNRCGVFAVGHIGGVGTLPDWAGLDSYGKVP
ncbi:carbohydrate kinase family protein [Qingshengfaniella alkalisoli]|uniref:Carbohydrate kinase n=1 Tax=Qingshengfaniella alkalisoli TaxID=2599296 RepID=A0A5B8IWZ2_9RHOB|nr:PfkB family carbohydrate kinase [Qingshengfaniella alkalisoli]QDY70662.1 carbohydrate kinase [Qingshengfaniella alkalisoli]